MRPPRWLAAVLALLVPAVASAGARIGLGVGSEAYALPGRVDAVFRPFSPSFQADGVAIVGDKKAKGAFGGLIGGYLHPDYRRGLLVAGTVGVEGWLSERVALEGRLAVGLLLDGWTETAWVQEDGEYVQGRGGGLPYGVALPGIALHVVLAGSSALFVRYEAGPMFPLHGFPGFLHLGYAWRIP